MTTTEIRPSALAPWRLSGQLTATRTIGEIAFNKNGTELDIWLRVDGQPCWFSVHRSTVESYLASDDKAMSTQARSDGNAEPEHKVAGLFHHMQVAEPWQHGITQPGIQCSCGWFGKDSYSDHDAVMAWIEHAGLNE